MYIKGILKKSVFSLILISGVLVGSLGYAAIRNQGLAPAPEYPKNEFGKTYGSALKATSPETEPDLIKAIGVDGTIGYVLKSDLNGEQPKTPEEALKMQKKESGKVISLYDVNGKKVIGKFKIDSGTIKESVKK